MIKNNASTPSFDKYKDLKPTTKKINPLWEEAKEFGDYVGIKTTFVLKLFKKYGKEKVLAQRSWFRDVPKDPKRFYGLVIWRMENERSNNNC